MASAASEEANDDNHDHDDDHDDENRLEHVRAFLSENGGTNMYPTRLRRTTPGHTSTDSVGEFLDVQPKTPTNGEPRAIARGRVSVRVRLASARHEATRHGGCPPRTVLRRVPRRAVLPFGGVRWPT
jgi:hypothetical protein